MPKSAEKKIAAQGGAVRYRTIQKGDKTLRVAVTRNAGPKGGKTVAWEINKGNRA